VGLGTGCCVLNNSTNINNNNNNNNNNNKQTFQNAKLTLKSRTGTRGGYNQKHANH